MKRAALVSEREPKDWMAPGGRHRGHSAPLGSQGLFKLRQYAELLAQDVAARARLFNFASEGERLAVGQRAPLSSCSISNGFDAGFNLRQPVVEGSLTSPSGVPASARNRSSHPPPKRSRYSSRNVFRDALAGGERT